MIHLVTIPVNELYGGTAKLNKRRRIFIKVKRGFFMYHIGDYVMTPEGVGKLLEIVGNKAVVEMDYFYLMEFPLESIKLYPIQKEVFCVNQNLSQNFAQCLEEAARLAEEIAKTQEAIIEQEIIVLKKVIEKVKPVIPYIDYKIEIGATISDNQLQSWEYTYLEEQGIILVNEFIKTYTEKDFRGDYKGKQLILTRSGRLISLNRYGHWSIRQGEKCYWHTEKEELNFHQAIEQFDFTDIVTGMAKILKDSVKDIVEQKQSMDNRLKIQEKIKKFILKEE